MEGKMYRKETRILVTLASTILIFGVYTLYVYFKHIAGDPDIVNDLKFWGKTFMVFIPIAIVAYIIIHIIFAIINKIVTNEDLDTKTDEMDKIIELKALRVSHWIFSFGFIMAMGSLAIGMEAWVMIVVLIASCFLGSIAEAITQIYFYRRGI